METPPASETILACSNYGAEAMQAVRNCVSLEIATRAQAIAKRQNATNIRVQDIMDACAQVLQPDVFEKVYDQIGTMSILEVRLNRAQKSAQSHP